MRTRSAGRDPDPWFAQTQPLADAQRRVERVAAATREQQRGADREECQRQLDSPERHEQLDRTGRNLVQRVRKLHDERRDEHRRGEEERIDTGEKSEDQERASGELGPGGEMAEDRGDVVVRGHVGGERGGATVAGDLRPAVRDEDQSRGEAQQQGSKITGHSGHASSAAGAFKRRALEADRFLAPLLLFVCFYVATLFALAALRFSSPYWAGLVSVTIATSVIAGIWERGPWPLGLFVAPRFAARELAIGIASGTLLVGTCALLIVLSTNIRHEAGRGFPWRELVIVFVPAVLHEELLFRGYPFQKLLQWNRGVAYGVGTLVFAGLHAGNTAITVLGLGNVFLGGILLNLAYERYRRLWFPIGLHLAWNVMSGPILGHEVSGYAGEATLFVERGAGPWWITGGEFGIEGSAWMTAVELAGIVFLWRQVRRSRLE